MIEPDHGFLKPQKNVLLKVGDIFCEFICCLPCPYKPKVKAVCCQNLFYSSFDLSIVKPK